MAGIKTMVDPGFHNDPVTPVDDCENKPVFLRGQVEHVCIVLLLEPFRCRLLQIMLRVPEMFDLKSLQEKTIFWVIGGPK